VTSRIPRSFGAAALMVVVALALSGCSSTVHPAAATVDGTVIGRDDFLRELSALKNNTKLAAVAGPQLAGQGASGTLDAGLAARWLDRLIVQVVIDREFVRRKLAVSPAAAAAAQSSVAQQFGDPSVVSAFPAWFRTRLLRRAERQAVLQDALTGPAVTDESAKAFFDANPNLFATTCISHILVASQSEASTIADQLAHGADFATLAKAKSTDPGSAAQGGALGCDTPTKFVREFGDAAAALPVGVVSKPVKSQFGWHVILVTRRDPPPAYDTVKNDVSDALNTRNQGEFASVLGGRLQRAAVHVDPRFGTFHFDSQGPRVDPPSGPAPADSSGRGATTTTAPLAGP